ncbi:MAG: serine--tRNA ligase [candidate division Zixibacteria bacterium RBG_16_43_9]|nr:MAG: serine--tRNA ligase [candidate division Zixibacteria bacterium RBG_16_43_9]
MFDLKFIRENKELVKKAIQNKNESLDLDELLELDEKRRETISSVEELKRQRNLSNQAIALLKKEKKDAQAEIEKMRGVSEKISSLDNSLKEIEDKIDSLLLRVPNIPHSTVPVGFDENSNVVVKEWGELPKFDFEPRAHWEIGELLGILDLARGAKLSGSGFYALTGKGALLERGLINFMLDLHTKEHGYREVWPPFMVNRASMTGTGQLPKLEEDMYLCEKDDLFLVPTAEVPVTNLHRDEILKAEELPIYYVAYTPCFRREAGSYGKDTRGILRVHQFDKVEMVKFVKPEDSYDELEKLVANAEEVLQLLKIPYRVRLLCTGDLSFAAAKCYDIEAWAPGVKKYLEVSSCSNYEAFQARRIGIKFKPDPKSKPEYVHTLNGSGVALARTVAALLENFQTEKGTVIVPEVLRPYLGGLEEIS